MISRHRDLRLVLVLALWSGPMAAQTRPAFPAIRPQAGATYVGIEVCQGCHEDTFIAFQNNPHIAVQTYGGHEWTGKACEARAVSTPNPCQRGILPIPKRHSLPKQTASVSAAI